jgi:hypothetical protein
VALGKRPEPPTISRPLADYFDAHAATMTAAMVGWFVCALFASVAYNWTFYYLLALAIAPREILVARLAAARKPSRAAAPAVRVQGVVA